MFDDSYMIYKGYRATVRYSRMEDSLIANVLNVDENLVAVGDSIVELENDFHRVIDRYLSGK